MATEDPNPSILKPTDSQQEQWSGGASDALSCFPDPGNCFPDPGNCFLLAWHMVHGLNTVSTAALCFILLSALAALHCPRSLKDLHTIRENFEWTHFHTFLLHFMLILTGFDQKLLCQQAYLVSSHEKNSITNDSTKTLHFKVLFYKCLAEPFPLYPSCPCSNNRAGE